ncbi:hypothetical protein vseg_008278 [Gypsophila vaccaria]
MSGYDYASRSGYAIHTSKPVSVVSYDGRGTRTYVTRVEERVEQVRRPSTRAYVYSSAMKAEKESRPKEVDDFINKILDEVNGPSVTTTTRRSDNGFANKFGANPRAYYEVEYVYVGSPTGSRIPRNYGDPYDLKELSSYVYDNPPKSYYGGQDNPSANSRMMSDIPRDYEVPTTQWERSSYPSYDASPHVPPPVESRASRTYDAKPDNRLKSDWKDYDSPDNRWTDSSVDPRLPNAYKGPGSHWSRSSKPVYDKPQPNSLLGKSPLKPEAPTGYGDSDYQWSKPLKPKYDESSNSTPAGTQQVNSTVKPSNNGYGSDLSNQKGQLPSREYDHSPRNEYIGGASDNLRGNPPLKKTYEALPSIDRQRGDSSVKPQSPKGYGVSDSQSGRSSSPSYDSPQRKVLADGSKNWGNSPLKPTFDQPSYGQQSSPSVELQFPTSFGGPGNQRDGSLSPGFEHPPRNDIMGRVPNNRWGNPPMETPNSPNSLGSKSLGHDYDSPAPNDAYKGNGAPDGRRSNSPTKFGSSTGYHVPNDQKGRSTSPEYEHPPRNEIVTPLRVKIPQDHGGEDNQVSIGIGSPSPTGNADAVANNRWGNAPVKTQSPRDYGPRGNQWSSPSSPPVYNSSKGQKNEQPNVAARSGTPASAYDHEPKGDLQNKDNQRNDFGGSNQIKPNGYQASPLSQQSNRASDNPRDFSGDQKVSTAASLQPKYSVYSGPASELVTVRPTVIDSREAARRYGHMDAPYRAYEDQGKHVITSRDALKKYNGYFF